MRLVGFCFSCGLSIVLCFLESLGEFINLLLHLIDLLFTILYSLSSLGQILLLVSQNLLTCSLLISPCIILLCTISILVVLEFFCLTRTKLSQILLVLLLLFIELFLDLLQIVLSLFNLSIDLGNLSNLLCLTCLRLLICSFVQLDLHNLVSVVHSGDLSTLFLNAVKLLQGGTLLRDLILQIRKLLNNVRTYKTRLDEFVG